jgi:putative ABC transport system permease protein
VAREVVVVDLVDESLGTFVYSSKDFLQEEFGPIPPMTALLTTSDDADQDQIQQAAQKQADVVAYTQTAALKDLWNQYAGLFYLFVGAMLGLGGLMAFAIIFTTMSVNIVERQRELATLRAAGVRQRTLAGLVGGENLIIAGFGVIPGLILGVVGAKVLLAGYSSDQFTLDLVVNPWILVAASLAIMFVAAISQWPGLRAIKRMNIAQVVRERSS